jgi:dethiobiotin synthetase
MRTLFVTSSGTGIGKTFVMRALIGRLASEGRRVEAFKPVVSGFDPAAPSAGDTGALLEALGAPVSPERVERVSPWRFAAPLSPDMAASREGRRIDFDGLVGYCRQRLAEGTDVALIEGIGGAMVPLDERHTVLDWIVAMEIPTLLVVGSYLGTLSHTLTAAAALRARGVELRVVVSESEESPVPLSDILATLARHLPGIDVCALPRRSPDDPSGRVELDRLVEACWPDRGGPAGS